MSKNKVGEERKWRIETTISIVSLLVSIGALFFTVLYNLSPGTVQPYKPTGYGIIRGLDPFPSDHLVVPLEWENEGGRTVLIRYPRLILRELNSEGKETGKEYRYFLAGEYQDISSASFREPYSVKRSFTLDPHSLSLRVLVFHVENWWDEKDDRYNFKFVSTRSFRVYIDYQKNFEQQPTRVLFEMPVFGSADRLNPDRANGYWWDFWAME